MNAANLLHLFERIAIRLALADESRRVPVALFPPGKGAFLAERLFQRVRDLSVLRVRHERFTLRRSSTSAAEAAAVGD